MRNYFRGLFKSSAQKQVKETPTFPTIDTSKVSKESLDKFKDSLLTGEAIVPFSDVSTKEASDFVQNVIKTYPFLKATFSQHADGESIGGITSDHLNKVYGSLEPVAHEIGIVLAKMFLSVAKMEPELDKIKSPGSNTHGVPITLEPWVAGRVFEMAMAFTLYIQGQHMENDERLAEIRKKAKPVATINGTPVEGNKTVPLMKMLLIKDAASLLINSIQGIAGEVIGIELKKITGKDPRDLL